MNLFKNKKGMEINEIIKIIIFLVILALLVGGIIVLFSGKGGEILDAIRKVLRFGRV